MTQDPVARTATRMARSIESPIVLSIALSLPFIPARAQQPSAQLAPNPLIESGHIDLNGRAAAYTIHHLPPNAFPDLPASISDTLDRRGCVIPQTYEAHHPENLIHASFEHEGSSDWALLCASKNSVSLLVFFASAPDHPTVLATRSETERLQAHGASATLGFNWAIDRASPQQIHDARIGMKPHPTPTDHDALADSTVDGKTVYHFYAKGKWTVLDMPED
jgi:hypothetical protein